MLILDQEYGIDQLSGIAEKLAEYVKSHDLFTFEGELGAGKTTLVKALCACLGVRDKVSSPTYSLVNQYQASHHGDHFPVYHIDLYRLDSEEEAFHAGINEILSSKGLCLVEWPQRLPEIINGRRLEIHLTATEGELRRIRVYSREN
jgi:tRNA threonylcarbamoyladenosine biosynthesis protein TsaE